MNCDKCGTPVPPDNDATWVASEYHHAPMAIVMFHARHFLPVVEDGKVICPGSPSRAQYIEGQPPDPRYPYDKDQEPKWREAYQRTLKQAENRAKMETAIEEYVN
jgi:hypothetical protein